MDSMPLKLRFIQSGILHDGLGNIFKLREGANKSTKPQSFRETVK